MEESSPDLLSIQKPEPQSTQVDKYQQQRVIGFTVVALVILLLIIGFSTYWLLNNPAQATVIRDIFIIFMALESLLLGIALIILIIQLARLINLLQNEIKPILSTTNETVNTLKGTTAFLSNNLVDPVIKLNEYLASFQRLLQMAGLLKKK